MAEETIKITVGADTSQLNAELTKAQNNLKLFQQALAKSTNVNEIKYLQKNIGLLEGQIGSLSSSLTGKLNQSSNQATNTLTNLNRVVEDAPYGFIGIANNINPLIESFGRLRAESGSTGGAFKSLLSSLTGPAGIGIAVAAITTAITFAQTGFQRWGASAQKAKSDSEDFAKGLKDAEQGAIAQGLKLQSLLTIVADTTQTEEKRNIALKNANELLKSQGEKLDSVNISQQQVNDITEKYTNILVNQAIAQKLANKIADLTIQKNDNLAQQQLQIATVSGAAANKTAQANKIVSREYGTSDRAALNYLQTNQNLSDEQNKLNKLKSDGVNIQKQINDLTAQFNTSIAASNVAPLDEKKAKTTKDSADSIEKTLAKLREDLKDQVNVQIGLTGIVGEDPSTLENRIGLVTTAIKKLITEFNVDPKSSLIIGLTSELNELLFVQKAQENFRKAEETVKKFNFGIKVPILPVVDTNKPIPLPNNLVNFADSANQFMIDAGVAIGTSFADGISAAISGTASFGDVFKGILSALGQTVSAFGKQLVKLGILALAAKKSMENAFSNPYLLIAAGIALSVFGTLLSQTSKKQGFAVGTNFAPGGMALVGERGPEMVSLPRGAKVTPSAQTAQMMGGAMQQVEVFGTLRGQDIYFSNKKYSQTYRRTT